MTRVYRPTPRAITVGFMLSVGLPAALFFPLVEYQTEFWVATIVTVLIGDSVTTGLLGKYGLEEHEGGFTRWAYDAQPSMQCSVLTRASIFLFALTLYTTIIWSGVGLEYPTIARTVFVFPLLLALGGLAATVLNSYAIVSAARNSNIQ